jgi:hypothetical protein
MEAPQSSARFAYCNDFGMSRRIVAGDDKIPPFGDDLAVMHDHCPEWSAITGL